MAESKKLYAEDGREIILKTDHLCIQFGGLKAVDDVNLEIKQGDTEELSLIERIIRIIQELFSFIAKMFGGNSSGSSGSSSSSGSSGSSSSSGSSGSSDAVYTYTGA